MQNSREAFMQLAKGWKDYELLDAGGGEKLERWGKIKVVRPDPQAFWPKAYEWEKPDMHYHRSSAGGGKWEVLSKKTPAAWTVGYEGLRFNIRPTGFKHMGLFPEQAVNWSRYRQFGLQGARILNLFAYTGGATLACLQDGADVTHVDAAKSMNAWAKENIALSGLSAKKHRILADDCLKFVRREARRGSKYDGIIMDPPVYGRGPDGKMWKLEENLCELVFSCMAILSDTPLFVQINAYTAGFSPYVFANILEMAGRRAGIGEKSVAGEVGLLATSGVSLPCGMYAALIC